MNTKQRCCKISFMTLISHVELMLLFATLIADTNAQELGVDLCACSPKSYRMTFDFSSTCSFQYDGGLVSSSCRVQPLQDQTVTDLKPVAVDLIEVMELGQGLEVIVSEEIQGNFVDGDSFNYVSVTSDSFGVNVIDDVPRAIQFNFYGNNQNDDRLLSFSILSFSNDCDNYPVLEEGQGIAWTVFSELDLAQQEYCPIELQLGEMLDGNDIDDNDIESRNVNGNQNDNDNNSTSAAYTIQKRSWSLGSILGFATIAIHFFA